MRKKTSVCLENRKLTYVILLMIVSFFLLGYYFSAIKSISKNEASAIVREAVSLANNKEVEVVAVDKESDLWKVTVTDGNTTSVFYLTSDGKYILPALIDVDGFVREARARKEFINCLSDRGVKLYGDKNERWTVAQASILGGFQYLGTIFHQIDNETVAYLLSRNVSVIPVFEINGNFYQGLKSIEEIENITGCKLNITPE